MITFTRILKLSSVAGLLFTIGCQPAPSRETRRFGRTAFGTQSRSTVATTVVTPITNVGGDMVMSYVANQFTAPALADQPQWQLGYVSATTGVTMWSESYVVRDNLGDGSSGSIDPKRSRLHIEISDSNVGQSDGADGTLKPFVLHIEGDDAGVNGAVGGIINGQVNLTYNQSGFGSVIVTGSLSGSTFTGQVSFKTVRNSSEQLLGQFSMVACGFFVCQ